MAYLRLVVAVVLMILSRHSSSCLEDAIFNVVKYGARDDGTTDSTNAFQIAWHAACNCTDQQPTLYVPKGSFLVNKIIFNGPCNTTGHLLFHIDGTIVSSLDYTSLDNVWIEFYQISGIQILGGLLDGRGNTLWDCKNSDANKCPHGATSLQISNCDHVNVTGLTSKDSELFHIHVCNSEHVTLERLNITSPWNSPNTDGIHVSLSNDVYILGSDIGTGDDCISIGEGTTSLWIENVNCGPGHGISIGSLGRSHGEAEVENITVTSCTFTNTQNGLRIKTYPTNHTGLVNEVTFKHNIMNNVSNPILIDQHYCNGKAQYCSGQESGVKISNVSYIDIHGTSSNELGVNFNCSKANPCSGIYMETINILNGQASCNNAFGTSSGTLTPSCCLAKYY